MKVGVNIPALCFYDNHWSQTRSHINGSSTRFLLFVCAAVRLSSIIFSARIRRDSIRSFSIRLLLCVSILCVIGGTKMVAGTAELLKPQFSITLPNDITSTGYKILDAPAEIQWSPDNRYLAISGFDSGKLYLLDVDQKQLIDRNIHFKGGPPNIAWSADSSLIALIHVDVALFQAADGKEIARRSKFRYGRCSLVPRQAGAFTADGRYLWVSCGARSQQGNYPAAEKLTVPDLEIADSADAEGAEPTSFNSTHSDRLVLADGKILLSSLLRACTGSPKPRTGMPTCYDYAACFDLQAKRPCFSSFPLDRSTVGRAATDFQLLAGSQQIVSFWRSNEEQRNGPSDWAFEVHHFAGNQVRQFGAPNEVGNIPLQDFVVAADGLVIASLSDLERRKGRLLAWSAHTGELLQNIATPPAWRLALSNDGHHLAVLMGLEVRIYSVSRI
jgi:hypothetical protein